MNHQLPIPISFAMCGAIAGLFGGGLNQCFPVWVGAVTGCSVGSTISIITYFIKEEPVLPVARVSVEPRVIQNFYVIHELSGQDKPPIAPKICMI
jgi:hypothetical protein